MFWKESEPEAAWLRRLFFPLGPGDGARARARVPPTPRGSGPRQAWEPSPLLLARVDSSGISIPLPDSSLVRHSRRHALSPRCPAWRDTGAALAVQLSLDPSPPSPQSSRKIEAGPRAGRTGVAHSHLETWGSPACGCRGRKEARPQKQPVWIPCIPPPDKEAETAAQGRGRVVRVSKETLGFAWWGWPASGPEVSPASFTVV